MRSRSLLYLLIVLLFVALGGIWYRYFASTEGPSKIFPAEVNRDCAPWDGAAFTVAVQYDPVTVIYITIWQTPDIRFRTTFPMPDDVEAEQDGYAYILPEVGPYLPLNGEVSFQRVDVGMPLEGGFNFTSETGGQFEGRFIAEWGDQVVYCG
jgi:hypothetical protein